jgi:methylglyoxal synthase
MQSRKQIALIAHDNRKGDLLEWARFNRGTLAGHDLHATGTTGALLSSELTLPVHRFLSGPLGGDQQVGAAIAEGRTDLDIFFWDPLLGEAYRRVSTGDRDAGHGDDLANTSPALVEGS